MRHSYRRVLTVVVGFIFLFNFKCSFFRDETKSQDTIAERAMVASAHPKASSVGIDILKRGGNAVDAALAMAFALSMAEPNASGIGGGGFMVIKMADSKQAVMVDYREMAPGKATPEFYYQTESSFKEYTTEGCNSIGIPGLVSCAEIVLDRYGSMSIGEILEPAIKLAREGIVVSEKLHGMIIDNIEKIMKYPSTSTLYFSDMLPLEIGVVLKNEDLALTFEKVANSGPSVFYEGEIASAIVDEVKEWGGIMALSDLKSYEAKFRKPVPGTYRGYQIISAAPVSGGGTHLIELLNIMEGVDVKSLGHNSVQFIHLFTEAMKMVYADKAMNTADPDFHTIPLEHFIDKDYAAKLRNRIHKEKARFDYSPPNLIIKESSDTSHLSVVDEDGNIVALTQSINNFFGSGIVVSDAGFLLNDHLSDFDALPNRPNSIAPHKRPTSSIAPTIVLKDDRPFMTLGTPGGTRIISALAQIIMNVIDFGMSMDEAIEAPRVHCLRRQLYMEGRIDGDVIEILKSMGHPIQVREDYDKYFGGAQGILIHPETRKLYGGADSRRDGVAIGF